MIKTYYGPQTQKAIKNFPFTFRRTPKELIYTVALIKKCAAVAHFQASELDSRRKTAIVKACEEILNGKFDDQFVLPAFQGGAGTSNHMNVNEVIAARATEILQTAGKKITVHPNDHVNLSHSTNDVMPSALKIAAYTQILRLLTALDGLIQTFKRKARQFAKIPKLGRTHLQDAVPITLGDEFAVFAQYIEKGKKRIAQAALNLLELNLGGSAVGNSLNASPKYIRLLYAQLQRATRAPFRPAKNLMSEASSSTAFVSLSQSLTSLCVDVSKIANDLRLLASGPKGGLAEIHLPELQAGSSIMPGKVNPVLPEAVNQLYYLVSGNNLTIEHAAHGAQLEMSAMLPVISDRLLESLKLMEEMFRVFERRCVRNIRANKANLKKYLNAAPSYATALTPVLGYDAVAAAVKESLKTGKSLREIILNKKLLTNENLNVLIKRALKI